MRIVTSRTWFRAGIVLTVVAGIVIVGRSSVAQSVTDISSCQTITANGSYRLATNLSRSDGRDCITIRGNVTSLDFDGNEKTISVTGGDALAIVDYGDGTPRNVTVHDVDSNSAVTAEGNFVSNIVLTNLTVSGINVFGADDVTVSGNTVGQDGIQINTKDIDGWSPLRPIVANNTVTGGSTGLKVLFEIWGNNNHPCPNIGATVENNTFTSTRNDPPPDGTAAMRIRCATHTVFRNNTVRSTGTTIGLYLRDEADDGVFDNNTFWVNNRETFRIASGNDDKTFPARNLFRNNIIRSDGDVAFYIQGIGGNNRFEYNTFWSKYGNQLIYGPVGNVFDHNTFYVTTAGEPAIDMLYDQSGSADTWTNNIFNHSGTNVLVPSGVTADRWTGNNNLYFNRTGAAQFGSGRTLSGWRTLTGDEAASIEANPLLTNPGTGDFTLQAGSPARGAGTGGTDIGAKPYGSAGPPVCSENWSCGNWSSCVNGTQARTCTDANACGTVTNRPTLTQSCVGGCTESWSCGVWGACSNGSQSRSCTDANACGTTQSQPPLTQSCSTGPSCGAVCAGCGTNRILGPACTTTGRQCDGTNAVENIRLSSATLTPGQSLTVEIDYSCYAADDNLALWYYNGTSWRMLQAWAQGTLTGCNNNPGTDGTRIVTFTPDNVAGTQYLRAIEGAGTNAGDPLASASECPNLHWGNIDDIGFTVQSTPACSENWTCGNWSSCVNGTQTRTCTDANSCGTTYTQPPLSQSCSLGCVESWSCEEWSICSINGVQTRSCTDANSCGTTTQRPFLTQACVPDTTVPGPITDLTAR